MIDEVQLVKIDVTCYAGYRRGVVVMLMMRWYSLFSSPPQTGRKGIERESKRKRVYGMGDIAPSATTFFFAMYLHHNDNYTKGCQER
jgi:hypothetical protein